MLERAQSEGDGGQLRATIDRRDGLSYEEFLQEYAYPARPVHIRNAFPEWRALQKWTPEFFRREHGHRTVVVNGKPMNLGDYMESVIHATPEAPVPYLRETTVRDLAPELGEDISPFVKYALPNWLRGVYPMTNVDKHLNRASEVEIFIGGAGTRLERRKGETEEVPHGLHGESLTGFTDLHYDPTACPVLLCQIYGRKQFTVFSPEDTPFLYATGRHSQIDDFDNVDLARFPLFAKATPYRFVQEPGEAIYLPPRWWHATRMLTVSIAVGSTFAHDAHWRGVIDEVVSEQCGGPHTRRGRVLRVFLKADGAIKALAGSRLGESTHFRTSRALTAAAAARSTARRLLARVTGASR